MYDFSQFQTGRSGRRHHRAGAGIGRAIAETFATAGAPVMVSDRDPNAAGAVADAIKTLDGKAADMACDVTKEEDLARLVQETVQHFGKLTLLVSNAGGGSPRWRRQVEGRCWSSHPWRAAACRN